MNECVRDQNSSISAKLNNSLQMSPMYGLQPITDVQSCYFLLQGFRAFLDRCALLWVLVSGCVRLVPPSSGFSLGRASSHRLCSRNWPLPNFEQLCQIWSSVGCADKDLTFLAVDDSVPVTWRRFPEPCSRLRTDA